MEGHRLKAVAEFFFSNKWVNFLFRLFAIFAHSVRIPLLRYLLCLSILVFIFPVLVHMSFVSPLFWYSTCTPKFVSKECPCTCWGAFYVCITSAVRMKNTMTSSSSWVIGATADLPFSFYFCRGLFNFSNFLVIVGRVGAFIHIALLLWGSFICSFGVASRSPPKIKSIGPVGAGDCSVCCLCCEAACKCCVFTLWAYTSHRTAKRGRTLCAIL